ncbi:MAG: serine hydrolase [Oscillospiraceae bacterium]|nr:serine hydrolase [Oscillospiraceae bacterium]
MKLKGKGFIKTLKNLALGVLATSMMLAPINAMAYEKTALFEMTRQVAMEQAVSMMETLSVPGLVMALVDVDRGFTWTQGLGYADTAQGVAVTGDTLFSIGSTAKPFTAIAIMQLVEAGVLDLDKPIVTYLPEFSMLPNPVYGGDYRNITTRMLLNHTSGIHEYSGEYFTSFAPWARAGNEQNREAMNRMFSSFPNLHMQNQEQNNQTYNNTGYALLGILVARLTGAKSYFDGFVGFTQENIFSPAGMNSSSFEITPENRPYVALPYNNAETAADFFIYAHATSAGGMVSSAVDMARFMHIMLNGGLCGDDEDTRILQSATIDKMIAVEGEKNIGLGLIHRRHASGAVSIGHAGGLQHQTDMFLYGGGGVNRQGKRLNPTPAPESFERWIGRWGTIDEAGNENLAFTLGINESGFAYSMLLGSVLFLEEVVDDYTLVTLGRTRMHGGVRTFSIEDGVPTVRYSNEVFVMLSDEPVVPTNQYRFVIGVANFSQNENNTPMAHAPFLDLQYERAMFALVDVHTIFGEIDLNVQLGQNLQNRFGSVRYIDGQLFVPLAYVAYVLDLQISWDSSNHAIYIN